MSTGGCLSAATAGSWRRGCGRPAWTKSLRAPESSSISPALLRQLAGMGNNLNQIARRVNAGGGTGHDRVQIVAALMAIDAGLERLRHAVLEKGTDDDR
jgi:hypothetical protein